MRSTVLVYLLLAAAFSFTSCSRDPNVVKQRYLESGDKYFAMSKYNEARIYYRKALAQDMRFGKAYYKLGLTELRRQKAPEAVFAFRRYEDASLRYTGIESHEGLTHYGLYDTVVAKE